MEIPEVGMPFVKRQNVLGARLHGVIEVDAVALRCAPKSDKRPT
jgi:hypothetical protein